MNIIVGVIGAFIGGAVYGLLTDRTLAVGWNLTALVVSVLGAVALLAVVNLFTRNPETNQKPGFATKPGFSVCFQLDIPPGSQPCTPFTSALALIWATGKTTWCRLYSFCARK